MNKYILAGMVALATVIVLATTIGVVSATPPAGGDEIPPGGSGDSTNCAGAPATATFNPFPVTYTNESCKDYPAIDAKLADGGQYSRDYFDWSNGLRAYAGDEIYVLLYVHNGAIPTTENTMHNVRVQTTVPTHTGTSFTLSTTFSANGGVAPFSRSFRITTDQNARLEVIPGSGEQFNYSNQIVQSGFDVGNTTVQLGNVRACFVYSTLLRFKVRVVGTATPTPTPTAIPTATPTPTRTPTQTPAPIPTPTPAVCPLSSAANRTIFRFPNPDGNLIRSDRTLADATIGPLAFNLATGNYRVTLVSVDGHSIYGGQNQTNETYKVILKNGAVVVATSGITSDIPDNQDYMTTVVNAGLSVATAVSSITAVHGAYPNTATPNSNNPVCAAFDKIADATPTLTFSKSVSNITQGSGEADSVFANPLDTVEFALRVGNTGTGNANNVIVSDLLPAKLNYLSGTTTVDGSVYGDGIVSGGINVGTITPNQTKIIRFRAQVADASQFSTGTTTLTNTGYARADDAAQISDAADVNVVITAALSCAPNMQTVIVNQYANFSAAGGTGIYSWEATGGNPSSGSGAGFNTKYATTGTRMVTARSGDQEAQCSVEVMPNSDQTPTLTFSKNVSNITQGSGEADSVSANPLDTVEFVLRVGNTGAGNANNVIVSDLLPAKLNYLSGTTTVDGSVYGDGIVSGGINIGTITPNQTKIIRFRAQVADASQFSTGTTTLTNTGYARADDAAQISDAADVRVTRGQSTLTCSPSYQTVTVRGTASFNAFDGSGGYYWYASNGNPTSGTGSSFSTYYNYTGTYSVNLSDSSGRSAVCTVYVSDSSTSQLSIDKLVRNMTQNSSELNSVSVRPNDTVEFILRVYVSGNTYLQNIRVTDSLPAGLRYINGSTWVDGVLYSDGITSGGINVGSHSGSRTIIVRFQAQVEAQTCNYQNTCSTTLTNVGYARADNYATVQDSAYVIVDQGAVLNQLTIDKLGKNISRGEIDNRTSVTAYPSNTLEFVLMIRNGTAITLYNVVVRDTLPAGLTYINGTTSLNNNIISDGIVAGGVNIGSLAPYQEVTIRFNAITSNADYFQRGATYLANYAYTRADNTTEVSDSLSITILNGSIIGPVIRIQTGASLTLLTLLVAGLATIMYGLYVRTGFFKTRSATGVMTRMHRNIGKFNFVAR